MSREAVMGAVWSAFPEGAVFEERRTLNRGAPDRPECRECITRTSRAPDLVESGLKRLVRSMGPGEVPRC